MLGPRQTGKTTLAKALAARLKQPFEYFNADSAIIPQLWTQENLPTLRQNFLITERRKLLDYHGLHGRNYFWRNKKQAEVDYVEEIDGKIIGYEFKWNPAAKVKFPSAFTEIYQPVEIRVIYPQNFWQWRQDFPY